MDPKQEIHAHTTRNVKKPASQSSCSTSAKSDDSMDNPPDFSKQVDGETQSRSSGYTSDTPFPQNEGADRGETESIASGHTIVPDPSENPLTLFDREPFPQNEGQGEVACDICAEEKAVKTCLTCNISYCESDVRLHYTVKALQRHQLRDVTVEVVERLCQHYHRPLDIFCRTDQMHICSVCLETSHKGHDVTFQNRKQADGQVLSRRHDQRLALAQVLPPPLEIHFLSVKSDSVTLSWEPPEGPEHPQTFRVDWRCDGQPEDFVKVRDIYQIEINELKPGRKYNFYVATEGEDGRLSQRGTASTLTVVPSPRNLTVKDLGQTSFSLRWNKGDKMENISHSFLLSNKSPHTKSLAISTNHLSRTLSDLQPGTEYTISVSTVLANGEQSPPLSTTVNTQVPVLTNNDELRIVLLGKTGVGKSATGNTILGKEVFTSRSSPSSVTTDCSKKKGVVNGQSVAVIDTPPVFDTTHKEEVVKNNKLCICLSAPGPQVFLIVFQIGRFTAEEQEAVKIIETMFGKDAANYSMVLFTHGDLLEEVSTEDCVRTNKHLRRLDQFNGEYHVFNNKDEDPSQVTELLKKINKMVEMNGGSHYTNEKFQEAEKAIEEERRRIMKEGKEKEDAARAEAEKNNSFINN